MKTKKEIEEKKAQHPAGFEPMLITRLVLNHSAPSGADQQTSGKQGTSQCTGSMKGPT